MIEAPNYAGEIYEDYDELAIEKPKLAHELLDVIGKGNWQNESLQVYDSLEDFAYRELTEGWYADLGLDKHDYHGAPDPLDYIDLLALGTALSRTWDDSCYYCSKDNEVVQAGDSFY